MDFVTDFMNGVDMIKGRDVAGIGLLLSVAVRFYRMIPGAPWPSEGKNWIVLLALGVSGFVSSLLTGALAFGVDWGSAVAAALGTAITAMGVNKATEAVGAAIQPPVTAEEKPSVWKKILGVFLPAGKK